MEAIVLAGGLGTRLRAEVPQLPKPMAPIDGRPFLSHQLDYWIDEGVTRFVLTVGYMAEKIIAFYGKHYRGVEIAYSIESEPMGTGGGIALGVREIQNKDCFIILNGDTFFEVELHSFLNFHRNQKSDLTMALREVENKGRYGSVQTGENGRVEAFLPKSTGRVQINGGVYIASEKILSAGETTRASSFESDWLPKLVEERNVYARPYATTFIDIGIPEDYNAAKKMIPKREGRGRAKVCRPT